TEGYRAFQSPREWSRPDPPVGGALMRTRVVSILALLGGAEELACTGTVSGALIGDDAGVGGVVVSVSPQASSVLPQGTATFTATVTGTPTGQSTAVTWSVQESGGGAIDGTGEYTRL